MQCEHYCRNGFISVGIMKYHYVLHIKPTQIYEKIADLSIFHSFLSISNHFSTKKCQKSLKIENLFLIKKCDNGLLHSYLKSGGLIEGWVDRWKEYLTCYCAKPILCVVFISFYKSFSNFPFERSQLLSLFPILSR